MYTLLNLAFFGPLKYVFVNILFLLSYCHFIKKKIGKKIQCIHHNKKILYRNHGNMSESMKSNSTKYIGSFLLQFVYKNGFELSSIEQKTDGFRWWHSFVMFCFWQIKVLKFKIKRIFVKLIYFIEGVHFRWILLEDFFFLNAIFFYLHFMFRRMFFLFSTWFFNMVHSNLGNLIKFCLC